MPRPPPPADALMITGRPISSTAVSAWSSVSSRPVPGKIGTPALTIAARAEILPPIRRISAGVGPMKRSLQRSHISANSAFSDRKPYPGCTASAPVTSAALMIAGMCRYDCLAGGGPMHTLSSANLTCSAFESAVECTATVAIPSSRQARITRSAISPRFAIRTFLNISPA